MAKYRVLRAISVRLAADPAHPDYERFQDWLPGETVVTGSHPEHLDISGLLAIGALEELPVEAPARRRRDE